MSRTGSKERRLDARACLEDMLECVSAIHDYIDGMAAQEFERDGKTLDAVLRRLEVLGEAAGRLLRAGKETGSSFPGLALREVYDMRNALIHGYDGIDVSVVWKTITRDIPKLREALIAELTNFPSE